MNTNHFFFFFVPFFPLNSVCLFAKDYTKFSIFCCIKNHVLKCFQKTFPNSITGNFLVFAFYGVRWKSKKFADMKHWYENTWNGWFHLFPLNIYYSLIYKHCYLTSIFPIRSHFENWQFFLSYSQKFKKFWKFYLFTHILTSIFLSWKLKILSKNHDDIQLNIHWRYLDTNVKCMVTYCSGYTLTPIAPNEKMCYKLLQKCYFSL